MSVYIDVFTPMPSARVARATIVKAGAFRSVRMARAIEVIVSTTTHTSRSRFQFSGTEQNPDTKARAPPFAGAGTGATWRPEGWSCSLERRRKPPT